MTKTLPILLLAALSSACVGDVSFPGPDPSTENPAANAAPDAAPIEDSAGLDYFQAYVQPILLAPRPKGACAICHQGVNPGDGPDFMGQSPADNYTTLLSSVGLIGSSPDYSRLVTRGDHDGNSFCSGVGIPYNQCDRDEFAVLSEWIRVEAGY